MEQRILITGGAGFIGSHLSERLSSEDRNVVVIDDLSTGRLGNITHLKPLPNFQFVRETIMNSQVLDRLASEADVIVHLAAAVGVKLIVEDPVHTIRANIMGAEEVMAAANRYGCKVLIASTSEVYGKGVKIPFREDDDRLLGSTSTSRWAYAASKAVDELLGLAYHRQFGLPVVIMRLFNTVGPRQTGRYGMVVPRFVGQALRGEPITVHDNGEQSRCFADVADVVDAIARLIDEPKAVGQIFNIGSTEETSIKGLADRVISLSGTKSEIVYVSYEDAYAAGFEDMRRRVPCIDKINELIGFEPRHTLDQILVRVIDHERSRLEKGSEGV